jgi:tetratricopeptide (TPR) repeat protein
MAGNELTVQEPEHEESSVEAEMTAPEVQALETSSGEAVGPAFESEKAPAATEAEVPAIGSEEAPEPQPVETTIPEPETEEPVPVQMETQAPEEVQTTETAPVKAEGPVITSDEYRAPSKPEAEVHESEPVQAPESEPEEIAPVQAPEEAQTVEPPSEESAGVIAASEVEQAGQEPAATAEEAIASTEEVLSETVAETQQLPVEETARSVEPREIRTAEEPAPQAATEAETTTTHQEEVLSETQAETLPLPAEEPVSALEETAEPIRTEEELTVQAQTEAGLTVAHQEAVLSEIPAEEQPIPAEEQPIAIEEAVEQIPSVEEETALVRVEAEVALVVKESPVRGVQKVEDNVSVVAVEPPRLPAVCDDECRMALQGERELPSLQAKETAIAVKPQVEMSPVCISDDNKVMVPPAAEVSVREPMPIAIAETGVPSVQGESAVAVQPQEDKTPSKIEEQTEVEIVPSADSSATVAPAVIIQPVPIPEVIPIPSESVLEAPSEPEIPINDRELKAAVILNVLGENARALEEIDLYIREKSGSHDARHVKANILNDLGRLPECLEELKEAIRLDPKDEIALMDIESLSRRLGRKEESMRILALLTPDKEVKAREAVGLLEAKLYDDVISKYANLGPLDSLVSRMCVATAMMAKAKYRDAYRVLKDILLEHPAYPEALNNMGVCMRFMGEYGYEEPMHFMHLAVEADPNYGDAWNNIGATLFVLGDYGGAMEAIRRAVAVDRRADYLINLSKCQVMVGDIDGAKLSLSSALKYEETAEIDFALALIAEKEGEMKWALKLYDSAIELHPDFKDAIFNRQRVKLYLKYTQK